MNGLRAICGVATELAPARMEDRTPESKRARVSASLETGCQSGGRVAAVAQALCSAAPPYSAIPQVARRVAEVGRRQHSRRPHR